MTWILFVLGGIAALALFAAWSSHMAHAATLTRLGARYGVERWPNESLRDFEDRVRNRIFMKGWRN